MTVPILRNGAHGPADRRAPAEHQLSWIDDRRVVGRAGVYTVREARLAPRVTALQALEFHAPPERTATVVRHDTGYTCDCAEARRGGPHTLCHHVRAGLEAGLLGPVALDLGPCDDDEDEADDADCGPADVNPDDWPDGLVIGAGPGPEPAPPTVMILGAARLLLWGRVS